MGPRQKNFDLVYQLYVAHIRSLIPSQVRLAAVKCECGANIPWKPQPTFVRMGSSQSHSGCVEVFLRCIARKRRGKKCDSSQLRPPNTASKQDTTRTLQENDSRTVPVKIITSPGNDLSGLLQQFAKTKPIEIDSRVEAQQEKYLESNCSTNTACDDMDIDVVDPTLIDDTSDTEPHADIGIVGSEDMLLSPRSPEDDAISMDDMDLSQQETHFVPQPPSPMRPSPRLQPAKESDSALSSMAARHFAAIPNPRAADGAATPLPRHNRPAVQAEPCHKPSHRVAASAARHHGSAGGPRHQAVLPNGDDALDAELDAVMHNWRVMHGIAGRAAAPPPSPLAPGSTHVSFQLAE